MTAVSYTYNAVLILCIVSGIVKIIHVTGVGYTNNLIFILTLFRD